MLYKFVHNRGASEGILRIGVRETLERAKASTNRKTISPHGTSLCFNSHKSDCSKVQGTMCDESSEVSAADLSRSVAVNSANSEREVVVAEGNSAKYVSFRKT